MTQTIGAVVTRSAVVVAADWTVVQVAQAMRDGGTNAAVVDHGNGFCVVTDGDIAQRAVAAGSDPEATLVGSFSCRSVVSLPPGHLTAAAPRFPSRGRGGPGEPATVTR